MFRKLGFDRDLNGVVRRWKTMVDEDGIRPTQKGFNWFLCAHLFVGKLEKAREIVTKMEGMEFLLEKNMLKRVSTLRLMLVLDWLKDMGSKQVGAVKEVIAEILADRSGTGRVVGKLTQEDATITTKVMTFVTQIKRWHSRSLYYLARKIPAQLESSAEANKILSTFADVNAVGPGLTCLEEMAEQGFTPSKRALEDLAMASARAEDLPAAAYLASRIRYYTQAAASQELLLFLLDSYMKRGMNLLKAQAVSLSVCSRLESFLLTVSLLLLGGVFFMI